jgi:hypothetical protein
MDWSRQTGLPGRRNNEHAHERRDVAQGIGGFALYLTAFALYFLPTLVASYRRAASLSPVTVVNLFLGWTVMGWIVALAMAVSGPSRRVRKPPKVRRPAPYQWQLPPWRPLAMRKGPGSSPQGWPGP